MKATQKYNIVMEELNELNYWSGKEIFRYEPQELTQELRDKAITRDGNNAYYAAVYLEKEGSWRTPLVKQIEGMCKNFIKNLDLANTDKWEWGGMKPDTVGIYREIIPFPDTSKSMDAKIVASFIGFVKGMFGNMEVEFFLRLKNGYLPEYDWTSDHMDGEMEEYLAQAKVQAYLKKAYLDIPDTQEEDEKIMNSKKVKTSYHTWTIEEDFGKLPKSFVAAAMTDPAIRAFIGLGDEMSDKNWSKIDFIKLFNELNKKYYKEWQKIHRKGIKGALRNAKAWFLSLREHEEFNGAPMVVESFDTFINEMYMGPADGKGSFDDHQKKQQGYYKDAVSAEPGGFGNGGNSGAPAGAVGEDGPTMMSDRLGDIEADGYPSAEGQDFKITQPGTTIVSHDNMRGEPMLTKTN